jgi:hypothetical protein
MKVEHAHMVFVVLRPEENVCPLVQQGVATDLDWDTIVWRGLVHPN